MDETLETKLKLLLAEREIERVLKLYCRGIDRMDVELLKSIYHPDGTDDHGAFNGNGHEFAAFIVSFMTAHVIDGMHTVTQSVIDVDGDFATSEAYYWAYQRLPGGSESVHNWFGETYAEAQRRHGTIESDHDYFCGGRYIDLFEHRGGAWKILRRKITNEWGAIQPNTRITDQGFLAMLNLPGSRDRNDPAYLNKIPAR